MATVVLGVLYVVAGILETIRVVTTGDGGLLFWFGTLVGGGTALLLGSLVFGGRPRLSRTLVVVGALAGVLATSWTLVVPLLALTVVIVTLREGSQPPLTVARRAHRSAGGVGERPPP